MRRSISSRCASHHFTVTGDSRGVLGTHTVEKHAVQTGRPYISSAEVVRTPRSPGGGILRLPRLGAKHGHFHRRHARVWLVWSMQVAVCFWLVADLARALSLRHLNPRRISPYWWNRRMTFCRHPRWATSYALGLCRATGQAVLGGRTIRLLCLRVPRFEVLPDLFFYLRIQSRAMLTPFVVFHGGVDKVRCLTISPCSVR